MDRTSPPAEERFLIQRVILVADRGLLSLENIHELTALADKGSRRLEFILAVPARRYAELVDTFRALAFDDAGPAPDPTPEHLAKPHPTGFRQPNCPGTAENREESRCP